MKSNYARVIKYYSSYRCAVLFAVVVLPEKTLTSLFIKILSWGQRPIKKFKQCLDLPFKKGVQNGYKVWTYEYNFYNTLGNNITKDMIIVFTQSGVVKSHQMMTNRP